MTKEINDPAFPGLVIAHDLEKMRSIIAKEFSMPIDSCRISRVKYQPNKSCVMRYECKIKENSQWVTAQILKKDEPIPENSIEHYHLKEAGILLFTFPNDPVLTWLPKLMDSDLMRQHLNVEELEIKLLEYTPQMRATFSYESEKGSWIGKTNAFTPVSLMYANYYALWKASDGKVSMPRPTGFLSNLNVHFQEKVSGERLGKVVDSPDFREILKKTAESIGYFHECAFPISVRRELCQELKSLDRWSTILIQVRPEITKRIENLRDKIGNEILNRFNPTTAIHADFHPNNVLVEGTMARIIDLDEMAFGDPALDIGRFLSSLRVPSLRNFGNVHALDNERAAFLEHYLTISKQDIRNIRLYEAASLLTSAASAFRVQRENWEEDIDILVEESEKMLAESLKNPGLTKIKTRKIDFSEWANDKKYIQARISDEFKGDLADVELVTVVDTRQMYYLLRSVDSPPLLPKFVSFIREIDHIAIIPNKGTPFNEDNPSARQLGEDLAKLHTMSQKDGMCITLNIQSLDQILQGDRLGIASLNNLKRGKPEKDVKQIAKLLRNPQPFLDGYHKV